ncbi:DUF805 domain-containing protein [Sulfitobacter donghicola]|uniref:Membrane protein n=1 Tax=Sulfitobacter donghicola DSW-25 = KCTC 12864 = JCM 14565 TaxID=1300350 RepID=A0A073IMK5_9RHOB|nr:DUF805 domain-containing protein [Sulfitobacter donghicola]KEJ90825.1 membrane protein [Sulfitobacter donghicola DSW-25 = KCTC 12864 = JCM 14565]KIN68101.1 putative membrane protein [Sulfitobacter donghicola DSW-25 = KCTC 12864 = JCM 14565]
MSNEWYYAVEGTSHGPVSQEEFDQLVTVGTIRRDTLVWQEGMEDWLPFGRANNNQNASAMPPNAPISDTVDPARPDANTFLGALKDGFARYVDFKTRSTRSQFWWWTLWSLILSIGTAILDTMIGFGDSGPIGLIFSLATVLPTTAVAIRRLHDTGRVGWWYLLVCIPIIGWIVLIVFFCGQTQAHANQWGNPPSLE